MKHTGRFAGEQDGTGKGRTAQDRIFLPISDQIGCTARPPNHIPYPHRHPAHSPPIPLSTSLSSSSHLPRTTALHSALTLFVAIPDPHDHQSVSIPTCRNSLNSTLPYPSHHLIRPAPGTQAFSCLVIAPIRIQPDQNQIGQTIQSPSRQPPNIEPPSSAQLSSAPHSTAQHSSARPRNRIIGSESLPLVLTLLLRQAVSTVALEYDSKQHPELGQPSTCAARYSPLLLLTSRNPTTPPLFYLSSPCFPRHPPVALSCVFYQPIYLLPPTYLPLASPHTPRGTQCSHL